MSELFFFRCTDQFKYYCVCRLCLKLHHLTFEEIKKKSRILNWLLISIHQRRREEKGSRKGWSLQQAGGNHVTRSCHIAAKAQREHTQQRGGSEEGETETRISRGFAKDQGTTMQLRPMQGAPATTYYLPTLPTRSHPSKKELQ